MNYPNLLKATQSAAGLRLRIRLQPMYGEGELIFPSTVAGGTYLISDRRIPGYETAIPCAIIDSVQSQANRLESALLEDIKSGNLHLPYVVSDFTGLPNLIKDIGTITCFEAPHRIFDAILRDSVDAEGKHFPLTEEGKAACDATSRNATAIFRISPTSLLLGSWDSTGTSGGLGEKYTRCVVSELVGVNCLAAKRAGVRVDPLNSSSGADPAKILKETEDKMWAAIAANRKKLTKPSELNHSSIPWEAGSEAQPHGGVTVDYIQQSTTISLPALRQLQFPVEGKSTDETSAKAQAVLAAMALHAAALNLEKGWHLRSRCDLILDQKTVEWEILNPTSKEQTTLKSEDTRRLLNEAIAEAKAVGLPWNDEPLRLTPSAALAKLVTTSQQQHREKGEQE